MAAARRAAARASPATRRSTTPRSTNRRDAADSISPSPLGPPLPPGEGRGEGRAADAMLIDRAFDRHPHPALSRIAGEGSYESMRERVRGFALPSFVIAGLDPAIHGPPGQAPGVTGI